MSSDVCVAGFTEPEEFFSRGVPLTDGPYTSTPHALFVRSLQYGQRGPSLFFAIFLKFFDILSVLCDTEIDRDDE
jgi:hypothetical protein